MIGIVVIMAFAVLMIVVENLVVMLDRAGVEPIVDTSSMMVVVVGMVPKMQPRKDNARGYIEGDDQPSATSPVVTQRAPVPLSRLGNLPLRPSRTHLLENTRVKAGQFRLLRQKPLDEQPLRYNRDLHLAWRCLMKRFVSFVVLGMALGCGSSSDSSTTQLAAPTNLKASILSGGIHLTWTDNSSNETEFQIERKDAGGQFVKAYSVTFDITQYHDSQVTAGATYAYRVRAMAGSQPSDYSNEMSIKLRGPGDPVSFRTDIVPIFNSSCGATTSGCHNREAYAATMNMGCRGWLALEDATLGAKFYSGPMSGQNTGCPDRTLHQRLTQLDAWMCSNPLLKYVVPNSTATSRLHQIVSGNPTGNGKCEKSPGVPNTAMPPAPAAPLSASDLQLLTDWINQGAQNN